MSTDFERNLEKYAELIVKIGLNLQPGQRLLIGAPGPPLYGTPIELVPLIRLIAVKAYQIGARFVDVMWEDEELHHIRFQHATQDSFEEFPSWRSDEAIKIAKAGDAIILIASDNPNLLVGYDKKRTSKFMDVGWKYYKNLLDLRHKKMMNCTLITPALERWADKVLPDIPQNDRKEKLWDIIFDICRVKQKNPVSAWWEHINQLVARSNYLNQKRYTALKYVAQGTDLTIGLPLGHIWQCASVTTQKGINFLGNFPSEEICTIPHKDKVDGTVSATKPRVTEGIIEDFSLTFSEGRVIKATAKKGEEILHEKLKKDEGSNRLGEVALVPHSSPISQSRLIFYNAVLDENASSHLALGQGLRFCLKNGETLSDDEFLVAGGNISGIHLDFMIGSGEMNVNGVLEDGTVEPIMQKGEWAFEL
ncbi:MAG: aminopeptidase [Promethearchaeota archaeon]